MTFSMMRTSTAKSRFEAHTFFFLSVETPIHPTVSFCSQLVEGVELYKGVKFHLEMSGP